MDGPLAGTLVVSLEQAVAAPYATSRLADAGARVIKVERPEGDFARGYDAVAHGESSYFVWLNRGKESVVLDIKREADAALLRRLLARADVFVQNLAPGAAARAGFDPDALRRQRPRLVTCDISGYGGTGPYAQRKAYDNLLQAETGLIAVTGSPDAPAKVGISIADISAGIHAYAAILEALLTRERSGEGAGLHISLFDCLADWMSVPYLHQAYAGRAPARTGTHHASIAPYGAYAARDGQILLGIQNEREWRRFCAGVLERPQLAEDESLASNRGRVEERERLDAILGEVFARLSVQQVAERLERHGIAWARLNSVEQLARHPQLRLAAVDTPGGPIRLPLPAGRTATQAPRRVPALDEHGESIRREFAGS
jgi:crotonobetainyl-CoA:carnitine CoA-transferase CaiB-like acyl-CoA transferase